MPARVVRSEINSSDSLSRVSILADLTFRALIVVVDDYGRIDGRIPILKGLLFPLRSEMTERKIEACLAELAAGPDAPIVRYEVDGRPFIALTGWEKHRGKGRRGSVSKCPEPLPRKSEEMHADPPGNRESRDENREAGIGKRDTARASSDSTAPRSCLCPDELSPREVELAQAWSRERGLTDDHLAYAWQRVKDWSRGKSMKRADWLAVLRNAVTDGWALKGYGATPAAASLSPAQAKAERTKDAGRKAYELIQQRKLGLIEGGAA